MILRFILHLEWHRGYLPRVSIKRAPYPGKVEYHEGWGWRRLVVCGPCSGVGYYDTSLNDDRTVLWPRSIDENHAVDEVIGTRTVDLGGGVFEEELVFASDEPLNGPETGAVGWPGPHDADETLGAQEPAQGQHGPVYDEQTYRDMAVEDGLIPEVDNTGSK